jgi:hypothetical protein
MQSETNDMETKRRILRGFAIEQARKILQWGSMTSRSVVSGVPADLEAGS